MGTLRHLLEWCHRQRLNNILKIKDNKTDPKGSTLLFKFGEKTKKYKRKTNPATKSGILKENEGGKKMDDTYMAAIEAEIEATLRPKHEDGIDQSRKNGEGRNIRVVKSEALSTPHEWRFVVIDIDTGEILDNAQGY